jgi:CheY-specific phosphatase CheX
MDDPLRQAAAQAASNVFETMFFVFLEPLDPEAVEVDPPTADAEWLQCTLGFRGPIQGRLRLGLPYAFACELATNFLGLEAEASEAQAVDMVKELSNMVCGNLFSIFDKRQITVLDIPSAVLIDSDPSPAGPRPPQSLRLDFTAENHRMRLEIETGPPARDGRKA